ncbi:DUF885 family protein [Hamadaea tsunoensis]|uniref:DUF885 family protein n=1 Tax=Hamadaea tsunoensis TaxID=53368 RepID=UPI0004243D68|nr:DUF885 family protein [Hamadaea tsunoensis]
MTDAVNARNRTLAVPTSADVDAVSREILDSHFAIHPHAGREVGRYEYDGRFPDIARPDAGYFTDYRSRVAPLAVIADPARRADVRTSLAWLDREAFRVGVLGQQLRDPVECLSETDVWGYVQQPYADPAARIDALRSHLDGVPAFLERAEPAIAPSLPVGQRLHALDLARALAADLRDVGGLLAAVHPEMSAPHLAGPAEAAAIAVEKFAVAVEKSAPIGGMLGPERLREWIRVSEGVDRSTGELIDEAQAEVDDIVAALDALAAQHGVSRRRDLYDLMERPAQGLGAVDCVAGLVERLRDFWAGRGVVTVETANPLRYLHRPRMFAAAEFGVTGPFAGSGQPHHLYLPQWTDRPLPMIEMLTVHEAYAGHYLHTEAAFRQTHGVRSSLRLWAGFVEGWAHYTEELAIEQGLAEDRPLLRAAQLLSALEAATRLLVYLRVHAGRWTFGEAVQNTAVLCEWPVAQATRDVLSTTSDWRVALYTFGKLRIREWRRDAGVGTDRQALTAFHDRLIGCGFAPLGVVRQYYLDSEMEVAGLDVHIGAE